jgi:hypothetical protein
VLQDERQSAHVIFVGMSEYDRFELVFLFQQIAHVGNYKVDAQELRAGEHQAAIDGDDRIAVFHEHHVQAEFTQASERNNF